MPVTLVLAPVLWIFTLTLSLVPNVTPDNTYGLAIVLTLPELIVILDVSTTELPATIWGLNELPKSFVNKNVIKYDCKTLEGQIVEKFNYDDNKKELTLFFTKTK